MVFNLFTANVAGDAKNCFYPHQVEVSNAQELQDAVMRSCLRRVTQTEL